MINENDYIHKSYKLSLVRSMITPGKERIEVDVC